jgi:hypothetical protein
MARRKRIDGVLKDVPLKCSDCEHFQERAQTEWSKKYGMDWCVISNQPTYGFVNPMDRPVPRPEKCPFNPIKRGK